MPIQNYSSSKQLVSGSDFNKVIDLLTTFQQVTALAGGTRVTATPVLNAANVEITVSATANDSVVLPPAKVGFDIVVVNNGVASAQIFANGSDVINATAGSAGVALAAAATARFHCVKAGLWKRFVSA